VRRWPAQQEVPVTPPILLFEALVDDLQALLPEPPGRPVTARVVVVAGGASLGNLAPHRGQPARGQALEGLLDPALVLFLDRQVQVAARPDGPVQVGQHRRPVLGRDVLHGVHGHDGVELAGIRQVLQRRVVE